MTLALVVTVAVGLLAVIIAALATGRGHKQPQIPQPQHATKADYVAMAAEDIDHLFSDEFRAELRNRGILRFEGIINEDAQSLRQDLAATITQLTDFTKKEMGGKLNEQIATYDQAMQAAQQTALSALQQSTETVAEQRQALSEALQQKAAEREAAILKAYEENMARIVEHYLMEVLGDQFDIKAQLPYIIAQMEAKKQAIIEDMRL